MRNAIWSITAVLHLSSAACGPSIAEQFQMAKDKNTAEAYLAFVKENPEAEETDEATAAADDLAFAAAKEAGTLGSFEAYMQDWSEGKHIPKALEGLDDIVWAQAQEAKNLQIYLDDYPEGKHVEAAKVAMAQAAFEEAKSQGADALRAWLKENAGSSREAAAWEALEAAEIEAAGDAGILIWKEAAGGKTTRLRAVAGFAGGEVLKLANVKLKLKKGTLMFKGGAAKVGGKVRLELAGDLPEDGVVSVVVVLRAGSAELSASAPLKYKAKKLAKKGKGKGKISLALSGEAPAGAGKAHIFLVAGAAGADVGALQPISNIVSLDVAVGAK
jgi:hypothetical protein